MTGSYTAAPPQTEHHAVDVPHRMTGNCTRSVKEKNKMPVCVLSANGERLMPTENYGKVRHLLKDGRAVIAKRNPFTIQLTYDTSTYTQPIEMCVGTGYEHIGVSIKTKAKEVVSQQYDMLTNERSRHDDCRAYRRTRRNRLRYRAARFNNRVSGKKPGWIAPSLDNKVERHLDIISRYLSVMPVTDVFIKAATYDTQLLAALEAGEPVPQGKDYQHGPQYGYDTLREAVFERDHYTCVYCKRGLKDGAILHVHHAYYWKGLHGNSMRELATCCEKCNTPANHKEGGKLWGFDKPLRKYTGEAFMNSVRWILYQRAMARFQGVAEVHMTYGVISKRVRTNLGLPYSCATDAYCMGELRPEARCETEVFQKYRRNNRVLSKFYDAKYYDTREKGVIRSGNELSSGRTNRNHNLDGENLRRFRGCKKSKGRTSTRKQRYAMQPGDIVVYGNRKYVSKGCSSYGRALSLLTDGKPLMVSMKKIQLVRHKGGWVRLPHAAAEAKK